jgi:GT2 family glycosyltransferase
MLEEMVNCLDEHDEVGFVAADEYFIDMEGNVIGTHILPDDLDIRLPLNCYIGAAFMYRSDVARKAGEYREDLFLVEDYEFFIRMSFHCKMGRIPQFLYYYMDNPNSLTATRQKEIRERLVQMRIMYLPKAETTLCNDPKLLTLVYYRIMDNVFGKDKWKFFIQFSKKYPIHFGLKYLFIHLPNRLIKKLTRR